MSKENQYLDLATFSARIDPDGTKKYWRTLDELADDPGLEEILKQEFPQPAAPLGDGVDRRNFLRLMGASFAMAGLAGCARPAAKIIPYVRQPEELVLGKPLYYATAMSVGGSAIGLLVESHEGRPTKIEGNAQHPGSLGATDPFAQAAVLSLYDPDRSETVRNLGEISTWTSFLASLQTLLAMQQQGGGAGVRILTETVVSPTLGDQITRFLARYPGARWHQYEPVNRSNAREGSRLLFGRYISTVYHFDRADVVLSLDSNFLSCGPGNVRYAHDFAERRRVRGGKAQMNRLYAVESSPSPTGAIADHRFPVKASRIDTIARAIAAELGAGAASPAGLTAEEQAWIAAIASDLRENAGRSVVVAGDHLPPAVHAIAHMINGVLGNAGRTISYIDPIEVEPVDENESLRALVGDMQAGQVEVLIMVHGNPVFTAPADLGFAEALEKVPYRAHLSLYYDETSERSHWHVPARHFLEDWSDTRAYDGTASIVQPLIAPLYNGRSPHELFAILTDDANEPYEIVRNYWRRRSGAADFEQFWETVLHNGVIPDTAGGLQGTIGGALAPLPPATELRDGLEIVFQPDPTVWDGRFANNAWLQELPKPITKITWDNPLVVGPSTAARLGLANEDLVEVRLGEHKVLLPVLILPGQPADSLTVYFGYGRTRAGRVAENAGFNTYPIRLSTSPWIATGAEIVKTGEKYQLASTQPHHSMYGRDLVKAGTIAEYAKNPDYPQDRTQPVMGGPTLYPEYEYDRAWGMVIDTSVCIGCQGCVVACVSENNIAMVGKKEVLRGREMMWLRIDHYYSGNPDNPTSYHLPVPCMHCENAPCEPVCPVEATTHSFEGINEMTYNRCVGTRYCSNNCPYKVRRFNFFGYSDYETESLKLMRNPDVTVRTRGVMEKCTYCVQRVNEARIAAEREQRPIRDGEVTTACQQACPTQAIVFGDINDPTSRVAQLKAEPAHYGLLTELNTQPRTTYLATIRNPNPEIA